MSTAAEIEQHLAEVRHETRSIEFKGAGNARDNRNFAKIARGALSMPNFATADVVLGVDDANSTHAINGLTDDQISEWTNFDYLSIALAVYADPPPNFDARGW